MKCPGSGARLEYGGPTPGALYCPECGRYLLARYAWSPNGDRRAVQVPAHKAPAEPGVLPKGYDRG